jgi:hypothetical protein
MDKKLYYILGTVFIITSGILYSIERFIAYFTWIGQMNAHTGSCPNYPSLPGIQTNIFVAIFTIISIFLFVSGYREK